MPQPYPGEAGAGPGLRHRDHEFAADAAGLRGHRRGRQRGYAGGGHEQGRGDTGRAACLPAPVHAEAGPVRYGGRGGVLSGQSQLPDGPKGRTAGCSGGCICLWPPRTSVFDVNTAAKLAALDGQVFLDETEDTYCVWADGVPTGLVPTDMATCASAAAATAHGAAARRCTGSGPTLWRN